jgi:hypothetical protein
VGGRRNRLSVPSEIALLRVSVAEMLKSMSRAEPHLVVDLDEELPQAYNIPT